MATEIRPSDVGMEQWREASSGYATSDLAGTASAPKISVFDPTRARRLCTSTPNPSLGELQQRIAALEQTVAGLQELIEERPIVYNAQLLDLGNARYSLRFPLLVTIEVYGSETVARMPELNLYASGVSDAIALMHLKAEIVATYERMQQLGCDQLGPLASECFAALGKVIEHTDG